jgi:hypothetical protein
VNTWKVILATLVILGTGVITGGLLVGYSDRAWRRPPPEPALTEGPPSTAAAPDAGAARENRQPRLLPPPLRKDFVERLDRELNLSAEQREEIRRVVTEGQQRTRELWRLEWIATRQKIRAQLTPGQRIRFEQLLRPQARDPRRIPAGARPSTNSPEPEPGPEAAPTPPSSSDSGSTSP